MNLFGFVIISKEDYNDLRDLRGKLSHAKSLTETLRGNLIKAYEELREYRAAAEALVLDKGKLLDKLAALETELAETKLKAEVPADPDMVARLDFYSAFMDDKTLSDEREGAERCNAMSASSYYCCSRKSGHRGVHVACAFRRAVEFWG